LTENEKADLLQLREEEKLARDVYLYEYDKYGLSIFSNISNSEQTHMTQVLNILKAYNIQDPASSVQGVFNDEKLQTLYDNLLVEADKSLLDALKVGATIEDLDIEDITVFLGRTSKSDISTMYESLACGSRNHLRSYYSQIVAYGGTYSPLYISEDYFNSIINSSNENCGR
jgi:hypothetical protein